MNAYSAAVSRQRRLNCFFDIRDDKDKQILVARGTPGSVAFTALPTYPIRGWRVVGSLIYVVAGQVLYSVNSAGVYTSLGTISTSTGVVSISDNGVQLIVVDGTAGYVLTLVTGSYKQSALNTAGSFGAITDVNFPNGTTSVAYLDGRVIVNRTGSRQAYTSEAYDATNWLNTAGTATIFTKENSSDLLSSVAVLNGAIILWGFQSAEFWQDVGNYPLPWQRINGATQTWGLAAVNSFAQLNNTAIFLGQNPQGGIQVMSLNGYVPNRISNSDIEHIITGFSVYSDAVALTYIVDGHPMYQITFPSGGRSFLYDSITTLWSEVQTGIDLIAPHYGLFGITFAGKNFISDASSGNIYQLRTDVYTDNGTAIKRQLTTRHIGVEGNEIGISELFLDVETGVGLQSGQGMDPQIMMQVSKDGGRTFGAEKWRSMGMVGQYKTPRVIWRRLGSARDFVFQFTMTDPVKFTVIGGSITVDQGAQ